MQRDLLPEERQLAGELNSGWNKLGLVKGLTTEEMQILCDLDLDDKKEHDGIELELINKAVRDQRTLAGDLAEKYEGCEDTSRDESLHKKYWNQAHPKAPKDKKESTTAKIYTNHSKYSEARLFLARLHKIITALPKYGEKYLKSLDETKVGSSDLGKIVPKAFGALGLSYGLRLGADIGIVLYTTFRKPRYTLNLLTINAIDELKIASLDHHPHLIAIKGKGEKEGTCTYKMWGCVNNKWQLTDLDNFVPPPKWKGKKEVVVHSDDDIFSTLKKAHLPREMTLTRWQRFKNVMRKGDRLRRMEHDASWFALNLTTFVLSFLTLGPIGPLVSASLGMSGTSIDVFRAIEKGYADYKKYKNLATKIGNEMEVVKKLRTQAIHKNDLPEIKIQDEKYRELELLKKKVEAKSRSRTWERAQPIIASTLLVIGLGLMLSSVFFPPLAIPGAVLAGAGISFVAGSLFTGLGKRIGGWIVDKVKSCFKPCIDDKKDDHRQPPPPKRNNSYAQLLDKMESEPNVKNKTNAMTTTSSLTVPDQLPVLSTSAPCTLTNKGDTGFYQRTGKNVLHFKSPTNNQETDPLLQKEEIEDMSPKLYRSPTLKRTASQDSMT